MTRLRAKALVYKYRVVLFTFVFVTLYVTTAMYLYQLPPAGRSITGVPVTAVFVDIDGDGNKDLLVYGEVIYNSAPLAVSP